MTLEDWFISSEVRGILIIIFEIVKKWEVAVGERFNNYCRKSNNLEV